MRNRRVLFLDDEVNVLEGIKRQIRKEFEVSTAVNPYEALALLESQPDYAVVVSDMRMPKMSGVDFLTEVKRLRPHTIRVMLTGNSDQLTAAAAVNQGEVFKFLNKPCDAATLANVLEQALRQYELITAERELLSKTLQGSIKLLLEALSIAKPELFGGVDRLEQKCSQLVEGLAGIDPWEMRAAARLSRLGCLGISSTTLRKVALGEEVSVRERMEFDAHPITGAKLVAEIPRLERVAEAIMFQHKNFDGSGLPDDVRSGTDIPLGGRILRLALAFDDCQSRGCSDTQALEYLRGRAELFDPDLMIRLSKICKAAVPVVFKLAPDKIYAGLTIAQDVQSTKGILLVCRGQQVTQAVRRHLQNFYELGTLTAPILVSSHGAAGATDDRVRPLPAVDTAS